MIPDEKVILQYINTFFRMELVNYFLYLILAVVGTLISCYSFKVYVNKTAWKAKVIFFVALSCALTLIFIKTAEFLPAYKDYKNKSYTIEQNCGIYIHENMNNKLEQKNTVELYTENGNTVNLKITNDYNFETEIVHRAVVIYTNNSKHIVWYKILD